ncbi:MAG TPA: hypothetical protein EYQ61_00055 [Dehalococcoidia bacterium]|jgi:hypothetical protein|nr:hypothetical protein [Dehalococcoidia bacterium]HIK89581.1 hypothetical protein [Dehalococcoidia bacterium]
MDEQVEKLLSDISTEAFDKVAHGVLDDPSATLVGTPGWEARSGVTLEQIPEKIRPVIAMLPGVTDEICELLG